MAELDDLTVNNNNLLKIINKATLPLEYPEEFYRNAYQMGYSKVAFYGEVPVGIIKSKLVIPSGSSTPTSLYIESVAVLEPYRNRNIGSQLVQFVLDEAKKAYLHKVTLHVWIDNKEALTWYKEKLGFEEKETVEGYYKDWGLENPDAVYLMKEF